MDVTAKKILQLLFLLVNGRYCLGNVVTFFSDIKYQSALFRAEDSMECKNLPETMAGQVNSVLTNGCTVLFDDINCNFRDMLVINQGEKKNLFEYWIGNGTRSFRRCSKSVKEIHVEVFRNSNLTGLLENFLINHNECNVVASRNWGNIWGLKTAAKALSVKTSGCIVAYIGNNCDYAGVMIKPSEGNVTGVDFSSYRKVRDWNGIRSIRACNESERTSEIKFFSKNSTKELLYLGALRDEWSLLPENLEMNVGNVWSQECAKLIKLHTSKDGVRTDALILEPNTSTNLQIYDELKTDELFGYTRCGSTDEEEKAEIMFYGEEKHENYLGSTFTWYLNGCTYLPFGVAIKSVRNIGTCLELYHEPGCHHWGRTVFAGETYASDFLRKSTPGKNATEDLPPFRSFKLCES